MGFSGMPAKSKTIPNSVLDVLKNEWQAADPAYSAFDQVFNDKTDKQSRKAHPSYYYIREGKEVETNLDVLSHAEALKLVNDGAFASLAKVQDDKSVTINEHAQHAMIDFCSEVYSAWHRYQRRLVQIQAACPSLDD